MLAGFPPFQKPAMNDWWFNKLATGRNHLFWEAHCRSAHFSNDVKDFINRLLQPEAAKRMQISDMIKHPWFQGPTIGAQALSQELQRRKTTVDENKMREKLERKRGSEAINAELSEDGDSAMMRGHGDENSLNSDAEALPNHHPTMNITTLQAPSVAEAAQVNFDSQFSSLSGNSSLFGSDNSEQESKANNNSNAAEPPVYAPADQVFSFTQFSSKTSPHLILNRLCTVLDNNKFQYELRKNDFKVRANLFTPLGQVQFNIQIYKNNTNSEEKSDSNSPSSSQEYTVLFRKVNGDSAQFRVIFADLKQQLSDLVVANKQTDNSLNLSPNAAAHLNAAAN
jgi:serine/threonine protein kinase